MLCRLTLLCAVTVIVAAGSAIGQTTSGTIRGRVLDPQGAPVPSAKVTVTGQGNGVTRTMTTGTDGIFVVSNLPPGTVDLSAGAAGFADVSRQDIVLDVGRIVSLDLQLSIGNVRETVVVGSAVVVDTSRSVVDAVIPSSLIDALPLNGRNFLELALLVPGNTPAPNFDPTKTNSVTISSAGQLGRGGNIMIDGADNNDDVVGGPLQNVTQEAVQEFQIATNRFSAESGRSAASVINIITKSGSDQFRGSASMFLRDSSWQATPATYDGSSGDDVPFDRQQFAGAVGGPLMPGKLFWFAAMEYRNQDGAVLVGTRDVAVADDPTLLRPGAARRSARVGSHRLASQRRRQPDRPLRRRKRRRYCGERARSRDRFGVAAPGQPEPLSVGGGILDANLDADAGQRGDRVLQHLHERHRSGGVRPAADVPEHPGRLLFSRSAGNDTEALPARRLADARARPAHDTPRRRVAACRMAASISACFARAGSSSSRTSPASITTATAGSTTAICCSR